MNADDYNQQNSQTRMPLIIMKANRQAANTEVHLEGFKLMRIQGQRKKLGFQLPSVFAHPFDCLLYADDGISLDTGQPSRKSLQDVLYPKEIHKMTWRVDNQFASQRDESKQLFYEELQVKIEARAKLEADMQLPSTEEARPRLFASKLLQSLPKCEYALFSFLVFSNSLTVEQLQKEWILPHRSFYRSILGDGQIQTGIPDPQKITESKFDFIEFGREIFHQISSFKTAGTPMDCFQLAALFVILVNQSRNETELRTLVKELIAFCFDNNQVHEQMESLREELGSDQIDSTQIFESSSCMPIVRMCFLIHLLVFGDPTVSPTQSLATFLANSGSLPNKQIHISRENSGQITAESESTFEDVDIKKFLWPLDIQKSFQPVISGDLDSVILGNLIGLRFRTQKEIKEISTEDINLLPPCFEDFYRIHLYANCECPGCIKDAWLSVCLLCGKHMHKADCAGAEKHIGVRNCFNHAVLEHGGQAVFVDCHQGYFFYYDEEKISLIPTLYMTPTGGHISGSRNRPYSSLKHFQLNPHVLAEVENMALNLDLRNKIFDTVNRDKLEYEDKYY